MRSGAALLAALLCLGCRPTCEPGLICAVVGTGELGFNGDGLEALDTRLASPTSVGVEPGGRVFWVDYSNMRIRVLTEAGTVETTVGNGEHAYSEPGATPLATPLENPVDATWGPDGLLYLLPQHEGRVIRVSQEGRIEVWAGTGVIADGHDGAQAVETDMGYGGGLAFASDGTLFVADNTFSRVRRFGTDGTSTTVLGTGEAGMGTAGYGPEVALRYPERIVVDEERGRLLVADTLNHRVLALDLDTLAATVLAGTGEAGSRGDGGPATEATLDSPTGLQVGPEGTVIIADLGNGLLRAVDLEGTITTLAGATEGEAEEIEVPEAMVLASPAGLAWTPGGDLLIAERGGQRILRWMGAEDAL